MFYTFDQNNTGGSFVSNDRVSHTVIIEANSADEANEKAESIGIYFDGCDEGMDCPCCGDRWYPAYGEGDEQPEIYGKPIEEHSEMFCKKGEVYCHVYYTDGLVKTYRKK